MFQGHPVPRRAPALGQVPGTSCAYCYRGIFASHPIGARLTAFQKLFLIFLNKS